jgi:hypothetical protein
VWPILADLLHSVDHAARYEYLRAEDGAAVAHAATVQN